jgi:hypothetical protein
MNQALSLALEAHGFKPPNGALWGPIDVPHPAPRRFDDADADAYIDTICPDGWERWGNSTQKRDGRGAAVIRTSFVRTTFAERLEEPRP